jgi:hypothetical protein
MVGEVGWSALVLTKRDAKFQKVIGFDMVKNKSIIQGSCNRCSYGVFNGVHMCSNHMIWNSKGVILIFLIGYDYMKQTFVEQHKILLKRF